MKTLTASLISLCLGFLAARLIPGSSPRVNAPGAPQKSGRAAPLPARSLDLSGDWKSGADAWASEDPAGFCAWLVQRGIPPQSEVLSVLFSTWAARDAEAAFKAFFNLPADFRHQSKALGDMMQAVFNQPDGWRAAIKWLPQVDEQIDFFGIPATDWTQSGPPEQMAAFLKANLSSGRFSGVLLSQFASAWARVDRESALVWMKGLRPEMHRDAFSGFIETWTGEDPVAALDYLAAKADSGERQNAFVPLAELAKKDPKAAFTWLEENLAVADSTGVKLVIDAWCQTKPSEARDYVFSIEDPALRRNALASWSQSTKTRDLLRVIADTPAGADRTTMVKSLWSKASGDPDESAAVREFVQNAGPERLPADTVGAISREYARRDPEAALTWVAGLPEAYQSYSIGFVLAAWPDKVRAALAVERLPEGPMKAAGRQRLMPDPKDPFR